MDAFYTSRSNISDAHIRIIGEEHHHLSRVSRTKIGEEIYVADGEGMMYRARVASIDASASNCEIVEKLDAFHEPKRKITLAQAVLKNPGKMDWIVEKATELGVSEIIPMETERTLTTHAKKERLQHLALAAMKQSLRCRLPLIHETHRMDEILMRWEGADVVLLHESAPLGNRLSEIVLRNSPAKALVLFVGPEGGFNENEVAIAQQHHVLLASLGARRLRSETAAIAALAILMD